MANIASADMTTVATPPRVRRRRRPGEQLLALLMTLPAIAFVLIFIAYPFIEGFWKSFYNYNGGNLDEFIGFQNYLDLLKDPLVGPSFVNVFWLTLSAVIQSVGVAFIAAWLIHHLRRERLKYFFRIAVMLPAVVPTIVGFLLWSQFLSPAGAVNRILDALGLHALTGDWFGDPHRVIVGLIIVGIPWLNGVNTLLFLASLNNIPGEIYDAAKLDRASRLRVLISIEMPAVAAQATVLIVLAIILGLQNYENVYVMTGGGPFDASDVPGLLLFKNAFTYGRFGYANAIGVVLFLVITVVLLLGVAIRRRFRP